VPVVIANLPVGSNPSSEAYDPANGYVYVTNSGSGNVSVLSGTRVIATVPVGSDPVSATYDGANGDVYVTNFGSDTVSVIQGTAVVATVPVGSEPDAAVFDAGNGYVYVADYNASNVSVLSGTSLVTTVPVGTEPVSAAYDAANGLVYVVDYYDGYVTVLNNTTVQASVPTDSEPRQAAYDSGNGFVYVANSDDDDVTIINGTVRETTAGAGFDPVSVTYDSTNGDVYVTNLGGGTVTVLNGTSEMTEIPVGSGPDSAAFDGATGYLFVTNSGSGNVSVLDGRSPSVTTVVANISVGVDPEYAIYDGSNGDIYVANNGSASVSVLGPAGAAQYTVNFTESGLPIGTTWSLTLNGTPLTSSSASIVTSEPNGTYAFTIDAKTGYTAAPSSGSITVEGADTSQAITFTPIRATYNVAFVESGLPSGTSWSVTFNGSTLSSGTATISFPGVPNGTYSFTVAARTGYTIAPSSGSITVSGADKNQAVVFTGIPATYAVAFVESGLPNGTAWSVTFNGSTSSSDTDTITFSGVPNGTFSFTVGAVNGFNATPSHGSFQVGGHAVTTSIVFAPSPSPSTTTSSGLSATEWYGIIGAVIAAVLIVLLLFIVLGRRGRSAVTFHASGLASGATWAVTLDGATRSSTSPEIRFAVRNGSYAYTVGPVTGYVADPPSGNVGVSGTSETVSIRFTAQPP